MDIKVSIIMPVYNTEKYIEKSIKSILKQSYKNFELIIVDDSSTDDSYQICKKISKKDTRIKLYKNKTNGGCAVSRNKALSKARGKYIMFVDSDDMLNRNALKKLVKIMDSENLDMLSFEAKVKYKDIKPCDTIIKKDRYLKKHEYNGIMTGYDFFKQMRNNGEYSSVVWLSIYKKSFIVDNNISFTPGILHEDILFTFKCMNCANKIKFYNKKLYVRIARPESLTTRVYNLYDSYSTYCIWNEIKRIKENNNLTGKEIDGFINDIDGQTISVVKSLLKEEFKEQIKDKRFTKDYIKYIKNIIRDN